MANYSKFESEKSPAEKSFFNQKTGKLSPHERMIRALDHKDVDRFPFCTYNFHPFSFSDHIKYPEYLKLLNDIDQSDIGYLCKTMCTNHSRKTHTVEESQREGKYEYTTTTMKTPKGDFTKIYCTPDDQPGYCKKHYVENDEDIEKLLSVPHPAPEWEISEALEHADEIGDKGIAYLEYRDPFYYISELFDQEDFAIRVAVDSDAIDQLIQFQFEQVYTELEILLELLKKQNQYFLFYTAGPERATPPLLSPLHFKRFIVPYHKRLVELIHNYGYKVCVHCHGRVKDVFPYVLECGFDAIEPIEPPDQGDIDLKGLLELAKDKITLIGYVQDQEFYSAAAGDIREHIQSIAELVGNKSGYICSPTCTPFQFPPVQKYIDNYATFVKAADSIC